MKKIFVLWMLVAVLGCTYGTEQVKTMISDPHYAQYKEKLDELEHQHLSGALGYVEYLDKKKELDDNYAREVKEREAIIHDQQP